VKSIESLFFEHMNFSEAEKYMKPEGIWISRGITSHEEFVKNHVPKFHFRENVHEDILKEFEIINSLMVWSYYKYQFFDVAYKQALQTMEMAFRIRYNELTGHLYDGDLFDLIEELERMNAFEARKEVIHWLRERRNGALHFDRHMYSGNTLVTRLHQIVDILNDLYDDIPLRLKRKELSNELEQVIRDSIKYGVELVRMDKRHFLHCIQIQLIDNKERELVYHLAAVPFFSLHQYKEFSTQKGYSTPMFVPLQLRNVSIINGDVTGYDELSKTNITIGRIMDIARKKKYFEWRSQVKTLKYPIRLIDNNWCYNTSIFYFDRHKSFALKEPELVN
jgi:hypothetical protein